MCDNVVFIHLLDSLVDALGGGVFLGEAEVVLVDLEGNAGGRDDDILDAVHLLEHPHVVRVVRTGVTQEHPVEAVHEIVPTKKVSTMVKKVE